eukprot:CAMPEP_0203827624 /NCGR_PEP_ID=MMETSP0115-20131106/59373_1 /ASSEMBLY_ACC=CAM_ASM_000227 /TAXON_ID=33651 /ORGANISM="Bicosoecid sp, Strain ms1" /LENGTH=78 /DNA_ID=CAMNT_0050736683 /DNA_START=388 /DNA_END=621 /DNA_ORIENTATION=+
MRRPCFGTLATEAPLLRAATSSALIDDGATTVADSFFSSFVTPIFVAYNRSWTDMMIASDTRSRLSTRAPSLLNSRPS